MIISGIFFILIFALAMFFFALHFVSNLVRFLFRKDKNRKSSYEKQNDAKFTKRGKIFDKDDGEYVSYEEIDDKKQN